MFNEKELSDLVSEIYGGEADADDIRNRVEKLVKSSIKSVEEVEEEAEEDILDQAMAVAMKNLTDEEVEELIEIKELSYSIKELVDGQPIAVPTAIFERYNALVSKHMSPLTFDGNLILSLAKSCAKEECKKMREKFPHE